MYVTESNRLSAPVLVIAKPLALIRMKYLTENIIQQLEEVQHGKLWIGSNFDSKLNQVNENSVFLRPIEKFTQCCGNNFSFDTLEKRDNLENPNRKRK